MTSLLDMRLGVQVPQLFLSPIDVHNLDAAVAAIQIANAYELCDGSPLDASQELRLRNAMGRREDRKWAAATVAEFGGRQGSAKTTDIEARELTGLLVLGEQLQIHTAHEFPTANDSFLKMAALFTDWDDLRRKVLRIRYANGEQMIQLKPSPGCPNGQKLMYKARTTGGVRGFRKADLLVYDEAQHIQGEHVAASGPTRLANPNPQSWYAGSGGFAGSRQAWLLRLKAMRGQVGRLAYSEFTAQRWSVRDGRVSLEDPDPFDRDQWGFANPGLGRWVTEEAMESVFEELGPNLFARECLCVWEPMPELEDRIIDPARWEQLTDAKTDPPDDATVRLALDAPPDRKSATFSVAGVRGDGLLYVGIREHLPPTSRDSQSLKDRVVNQALHYSQGHKTSLILPPSSPARAWKADLLAAGVSLDEMTPAEYAEACGRITDAVNDGTLRHRGNPDLNAAVAGLAARPSGDVEAWSRRNSSANIAPFVAATCALVRVPTNAARAPRVYSLKPKDRG